MGLGPSGVDAVERPEIDAPLGASADAAADVGARLGALCVWFEAWRPVGRAFVPGLLCELSGVFGLRSADPYRYRRDALLRSIYLGFRRDVAHAESRNNIAIWVGACGGAAFEIFFRAVVLWFSRFRIVVALVPSTGPAARTRIAP